MLLRLTTALLLLLIQIASVPAASASLSIKSPRIHQRRQDTDLNYNVQTLFFDQILDHTNPSSGTFKQRYFFNDQYYLGQGSPIILFNPGEQSADGFQTQLNGEALQAAMLAMYGAAGVVLERK